MRCTILVVAVVLAAAGSVFAQQGDQKDAPGTVQADPPEWMVIPAAPVLTPEQALESFTIVDGYRVELVASEPLVQDPVSIRFDAAGRMWVVEMRGYMPNADGEGEREAVGCIAVLEDEDGDGRMDARTTYAERLAMPRAVLPLGNGEALVLAPPHFLHLKDVDGDGVADSRDPIGVEFQNGFTDPEHAANSPTFGLDNWIYLARFDQRLRYDEGAWRVEPAAFGGQWGLSMDDGGRWFFNTNSDHLRAHLAPPHYERRHPHLDRSAFLNQRVGQSQDVWPIRVTPGVNRGYQERTLRDDGRLATFTAVCGPSVYRGDAMPELRGDVFVAEPAAHLVRRDIVESDGTSLRAANAYADHEFLASTDERFRPVDVGGGPDGAIYVVDLYRGLIQHRNYLTSYLRRQVDARGLAAPIHMGRIWRVVPDGDVERRWVTVAGRSAAARVALLADANGWVRDSAQRSLVAAASATRDELRLVRDAARVGVNSAQRIHAMWVLDGVDELDRATVMHGLRDADPEIRVQAVRLCERRLAMPTDVVLLGTLCAIAKREAEPGVALQLAFTLGAVDPGETVFRDRAERAMLDLVARGSADARLRDAIVNGLRGVEVRFAKLLVEQSRFDEPSDAVAQMLSRLGECVVRSKQDGAVRALLTLAAEVDAPWRRDALLAGVARGLPRPGTRKIPMAGRPASLATLVAAGDESVAEVVARIDAAIDFTASAGARALTREEQALFDAGASLYAVQCTQCHQPHGNGQDGLAPPLAGSEWVLGSPARLSRIVLHGLTGPIEVAGDRYDFPTMPDHSALADAELASILTYVRRAWDNEAEPIAAESIAAVRAAERARVQPWTADELRALR